MPVEWLALWTGQGSVRVLSGQQGRVHRPWWPCAVAGGPVATWRRNTSPSCSWLSRAAFMPASPGGLPLCAFLDSVPGSVSVTHSRWPMFPDAGIGQGPAHRRVHELRACDSHPPPSASPVTLGKRLFLPVPRFSYLCNEGPFQGLPQHSHRQQMSEELRCPPPPSACSGRSGSAGDCSKPPSV